MTKKTPQLKTNLHAIFATDKSLEEEGAWVEVNGIYGLDIKVRRLKSEESQKAGERLMTEMLGEGKIRKADDIKPEQVQEVLRRQISEAVLIDWRNLRDSETGEEIPYSKELAYELLQMGDFFDFVHQAAEQRDAFKERSDEEAEGN